MQHVCRGTSLLHLLDPARWDAAQKVLGAIVSFSAVLGLMWQGCSRLYKRAVLQARRAGQEDILTLIEETKAIRVDQAGIRADQLAHNQSDHERFGSIELGLKKILDGQDATHSKIDEMDRRVTNEIAALDKKLGIAANDVDWLKSRHGGEQRHEGRR